MRTEYVEELAELEAKMEGAERFAKILPHYEDLIIRNKLDGTEEYIGFGSAYKGMPFPWGIDRGRYRDGTPRGVTNYDKSEPYDEYLFNLYINSLSLYDSYGNHGLENILDEVDVFYYDELNTTFYATDEQIIPLLDALAEWYPKARASAHDERVEKRKSELHAEQERIKKELESL